MLSSVEKKITSITNLLTAFKYLASLELANPRTNTKIASESQSYSIISKILNKLQLLLCPLLCK